MQPAAIQPSVWIGFITFGASTAPYLSSFLKSLAEQEMNNLHIVAWDNTPAGESNPNQAVLAEHPHIQLMGIGKNIGFSAAYNRMIGEAVRADADFFLVINPDTILAPGALARLLEPLLADPSLGSTAPKLLQWDAAASAPTGRIDSCGLALRPGLEFFDLGQNETDNGQHDGAAILGPSGACGLYRLSALSAIAEGEDYFDSNFFMYKEDCDLAYRLKLGGYGCRLVSEAVVYHDRTASGGALLERLENRRRRSRAIREWSFINQHLLWTKYWQRQDVVGKVAIIFRAGLRFTAALVLEPYLLAAYGSIRRAKQKVKLY